MPTWPGHLPGFAHGSLISQRKKNWEDFETDYGPPLRSKRGTATEVPTSGEFIVSNDDADDIEAFYLVDCEDGALEFEHDGATYMWAEPPIRRKFLTHAQIQVSWLRQPS